MAIQTGTRRMNGKVITFTMDEIMIHVVKGFIQTILRVNPSKGKGEILKMVSSQYDKQIHGVKPLIEKPNFPGFYDKRDKVTKQEINVSNPAKVQAKKEQKEKDTTNKAIQELAAIKGIDEELLKSFLDSI